MSCGEGFPYQGREMSGLEWTQRGWPKIAPQARCPSCKKGVGTFHCDHEGHLWFFVPLRRATPVVIRWKPEPGAGRVYHEQATPTEIDCGCRAPLVILWDRKNPRVEIRRRVRRRRTLVNLGEVKAMFREELGPPDAD